MKAIILAAGRGSRLLDLTDCKPKCMVEVGGMPLLKWQLNALRAAGITDIAIVKGYCGEVFDSEDLFSFSNGEWERTNMVYSLTCASPWLNGFKCIVSYSDIMYPPETVSALLDTQGDIVIPYNTCWQKLWQSRFSDPLSDAESFLIDAGGKLLDIGRKVSSYDEIRGQYMGLLKITPAGWGLIEEQLAKMGEARLKLDVTSLLRHLVNNGITINTVPVEGRWFEVDNQRDWSLAERMIAEGKSPLDI